MQHYLLLRSQTVKHIVGSTVRCASVGQKHCTALAWPSYTKDEISHKSTLTLKNKLCNFQRARFASTIAQTTGLDSNLSPLISSTLEDGVLRRSRVILQSPTVPDIADVEELLRSCEVFAKLLSDDIQPIGRNTPSETSSASNLLSLEETRNDSRARRQEDITLTVPARNAAAQLISSTAYKIITDPKIYITPKLLSAYVNIQSLLCRPRSLPEIFHLYASKPIPKSKTAPLKFTTPNPNKPTAHIPLSVTDTALNAAIKTKDLPLCFDIINYSVCTRAFRYHKFLRKAFVPLSGAILAPFAVYKLASELSGYFDNMDAAVATEVLFAGILAYVGFTATIGVVAVTTSNDQMDRVTWASGTPLRERWMREEERMLIDRVAGAWGFQQRSRRGEEEGPDWDALREWIGMRGMVLDRTELMDGME
ncbi:MAG: hypothetical protein Q9209_003284 [Squamulea sp. 1 TL-2023]